MRSAILVLPFLVISDKTFCMKTNHAFIFLAALGVASALYSESVKDREGAVRQDKAKLENSDRWIYDNYEKGFAEAKRSGKPLLVVLRCVPCLACMGIDAQILLEEAEMAKLLDQFVCVRLINANALDLSIFQFDYDLSFTTMFFNADRTIYGRYGSWKHQKNSQETATTGYKKALAAALAVHRGYPGNKSALAGKQGTPQPFSAPTQIPQLAAKYKPQLDWEGKVVGSCVHCHMIGSAYQAWYRQQRKPMPDEWLHPWPEPETIGLSLASEEIARVSEVAAGTVAAAAGLQAGDDIVTLGGEPLVSIADVSWALHRAPATTSMSVEVRRGGESKTLTLALADGWRRKSQVALRAAVWPMRGMALGGLKIEDLNDEERTKRSIGADSLALLISGVGQYGMHGAAKKAGFLKDDVIVEIDGKTARMGEAGLLDHLLTKRFPGESVKAVVMRGGQRKELMLPMQ